MSTDCYEILRGSTIRVTRLQDNGALDPSSIDYAVSRAVATVSIQEVTDPGVSEVQSTPEEERRIRVIRPPVTIRHRVDIDFLRVDPEILNLITGAPLVFAAGDAPPVGGFGELAFGEDPFGGSDDEGGGGGVSDLVIGFDGTRGRPSAFALEVWSKLGGVPCGEGESRPWGYTLFPYLYGGRLSGYEFKNGLVTFNIRGASTRKGPRWGVGPHDLEGPFERLLEPVSRNTSFRSTILRSPPPEPECGRRDLSDYLDNGNATEPMPEPEPDALLFVDGGGAETGPFSIDGGRAA